MMRPDLAAVSKEIRKAIIETAFGSRSPHIGPCLSCVEALTVLYFDILRLDPWDERDIFILSKAHAAMALYSTLAVRGVIDSALLLPGRLPWHTERYSAKGIEVSAGALGHGFNIGLGMAYGFKKKRSGRRIYVLIGDGESEEGSIWEGAMFASRLGLDNFTAVMDHNNLQGYGRPSELCSFEPVRDKWEAFGWHAIEADGHDITAMKNAFRKDSDGKPKIIIARTVKGKGVSFMEDNLLWHYYLLTEEQRDRALMEIA